MRSNASTTDLRVLNFEGKTMKVRKLASIAIVAGIGLFGLSGCSYAADQGHGPYAGKSMQWFAKHPDAMKAQLHWCDTHLTRAEIDSPTYAPKHEPACRNAYAVQGG